jgi:hypothetical protein
MVLINKAVGEMTLKVVYYGPGLCGKTTNLQFIHDNSNPDRRGKLLSIATESDRTLFFDRCCAERTASSSWPTRRRP